jgi:hypothetical protein
MYSIEMWGLEGGWKEIDKIHRRFCKITLGMPRYAGNNVTGLELGWDSRRGKVLSTIAKYWVTFITHGLSGSGKNVL